MKEADLNEARALVERIASINVMLGLSIDDARSSCLTMRDAHNLSATLFLDRDVTEKAAELQFARLRQRLAECRRRAAQIGLILT